MTASRPALKIVRRSVRGGVQAEGVAGAVGPDLQNGAGGDRQVRAAREVLLIGVRNERAQSVVAAAQVEHDQIAPRAPLRAGDVGQRNDGAAKPSVNAATPPRTKSRLFIAMFVDLIPEP